jgi:uncharacterized membrane protein
VAVFLACAVEAAEAATIVLAAGTARDWASAGYGAVAATLVLAAAVAALGPAITRIPAGALRLVVGALLLLFGIRWLRKAVLRAGGAAALHDEERIFRERVEIARRAARRGWGRVPDAYGFALSFQGVLLEGTEVVFIVLTFGSNQHAIGLAAAAAGAAILAVGLAALAVRAPLTRIPENTLKFVVGVLLTGFGAFWSAEGAGARWPGSDAALLALLPAVALVGLLLIAGLRWHGRARTGAARPPISPPAAEPG